MVALVGAQNGLLAIEGTGASNANTRAIRTSAPCRDSFEDPCHNAQEATEKKRGTDMPADLTSKVVIVTGSGRGIGRATALALGRAGARVVVASRTASTVDAVSAEIVEAGGAAHGITCDVSSREAVDDMVAEAAQTYGSVDVLINCAQSFGLPGSGKNTPRPLETFPEDVWEYVFATGLKATLYCMQAVFPHMKDTGGRIINFGSGNGILAVVGTAAYNTNKEAIRSLTRTAAREWGRYGITANTVIPVIETESFTALMEERTGMREQITSTSPLRRIGELDRDVGPLMVFLSSDDSSYLTGMTFMLDGGMITYR
jgi:NAD(P)-dependent dehydrogenase (short-subunit alcohol dehydrogenase family)